MPERIGDHTDATPPLSTGYPGEMCRVSFDVPDEQLDQVIALISDIAVASSTSIDVRPAGPPEDSEPEPDQRLYGRTDRIGREIHAYYLLERLGIAVDQDGGVPRSRPASEIARISKLPLHVLDINTMGYEALIDAGIYTVGDVVNYSKQHSLRTVAGFGDRSLHDVQEALTKLGIRPS